ncbi:MAG: undecaprenyl-diphosphate phosphatase, partial [Candidatus Nanohaloarchaea archaeon]|nr:undecaprenyl-diphosphate phosphatase [Candidatus Nanohaloarchaea archaeon]
MTPLEAIVLGVLQGVFEWLPVSSEAVLTVAMTSLGTAPSTAVTSAIWLHTGTMLAALLYFR